MLDYVCKFAFFSIVLLKNPFLWKLSWGKYHKIHFLVLFHFHLPYNFHFPTMVFIRNVDYKEKAKTNFFVKMYLKCV